MSRAYHNLTAHYNVFFNGKESFKAGVLKVENDFKDDYTHILPVFTYSDPELAKSIVSNMDRAIMKGTKCIQLHSIKAKPKKLKDKKNLTPKEKDFFERNEYNRWIDDCYLLIGKAHFYKHDFGLAKETFRHIINEFPKDNKTQYMAMLWLARACAETGEYTDALELLSKLSTQKKFNSLLTSDFYASYADYCLKLKDYPCAIKNLEKAIKKERKKKRKIRYRFIMAQVYQEMGEMSNASESYRKVIKMNPPYEMTFNAILNRASSFTAGTGKSEELKKKLHSMIKDEKNKEYKDQIYYALGNISMREKNEDEALEYYKKSASSSVDNDIQRTTSFIAIAEIYLARKNYHAAGSYYDSVSIYLTEKYPDYRKVNEKTQLMVTLVRDLNAVALQDSLQRLAKMSEKERFAVIDAAIKKYQDDLRQEQLMEMQRMMDANYYQMRLSQEHSGGAKTGKWYFYNPNTVNMGKKEFAAKWGKRKMEDNWRRKNKEIVLTDLFSDENADVGEDLEKKPKKEYPPTSREFYLQHIPLTDSMMQTSHGIIQEALYQAGAIYKDDLKDYKESMKTFEDLYNRYPQGPYAVIACYQLYKICQLIRNQQCSEKYKNIILSKFPETLYAKVVQDPDYLNKIAQEQSREQKLYQETYNLYKQKHYAMVIQNANYALEHFTDKEINEKFAYIKTLSIGSTGDILAFKQALRAHIEKYPKGETSRDAKNILDYLDRSFEDVKQIEEREEAKILYSFNPDETHYVLVITPANTDINQLVFNLINYNIDNHDSLNLNVNAETIHHENKTALIKEFKNSNRAKQYIQYVLREEKDIFNAVTNTYELVPISVSNIRVLINDKSISKYREFHKANYR